MPAVLVPTVNIEMLRLRYYRKADLAVNLFSRGLPYERQSEEWRNAVAEAKELWEAIKEGNGK